MSMEKKLAHLKKLMIHLNLSRFEVPEGPGSYFDRISERMKQPDKMIDRDIIDISLSVAEPKAIRIYTAQESHHNGSEWDQYNETIPVFEEFLDFAISVLRNRVYHEIAKAINAEEARKLRERIEKQMQDLGL
jgi:hypothetical protein